MYHVLCQVTATEEGHTLVLAEILSLKPLAKEPGQYASYIHIFVLVFTFTFHTSFSNIAIL